MIDAVREAEHIEVSDDEVRERIKKDAEILQRDPTQLVLDVWASGRQELVRDELVIAKTVDLLVDESLPVESDAIADEATETEEVGAAPAADAAASEGAEVAAVSAAGAALTATEVGADKRL